MSDLERDIRHLVAAYVGGQSAFRDFSTALAMQTWDIGHEDTDAQRLAYDGDLLVAEFTSGHRTEIEIRQELATLLNGVFEMEMGGVARVVPVPQGVVWDLAPNADRGARMMTVPVRSRAKNALRREAALA